MRRRETDAGGVFSLYSIFVRNVSSAGGGGAGLFGLISDGNILLYFQSFDINKDDYDDQTLLRLKRVVVDSPLV